MSDEHLGNVVRRKTRITRTNTSGKKLVALILLEIDPNARPLSYTFGRQRNRTTIFVKRPSFHGRINDSGPTNDRKRVPTG